MTAFRSMSHRLLVRKALHKLTGSEPDPQLVQSIADRLDSLYAWQKRTGINHQVVYREMQSMGIPVDRAVQWTYRQVTRTTDGETGGEIAVDFLRAAGRLILEEAKETLPTQAASPSASSSASESAGIAPMAPEHT